MLTWHDLEIWTFDQALFWRLYSTVFCWLHAGQQVAGLQISSPYRAQMPPKEPPKYLPRMAQVPWELRERLQWSSLADRTKGVNTWEQTLFHVLSFFECLQKAWYFTGSPSASPKALRGRNGAVPSAITRPRYSSTPGIPCSIEGSHWQQQEWIDRCWDI